MLMIFVFDFGCTPMTSNLAFLMLVVFPIVTSLVNFFVFGELLKIFAVIVTLFYD